MKRRRVCLRVLKRENNNFTVRRQHGSRPASSELQGAREEGRERKERKRDTRGWKIHWTLEDRTDGIVKERAREKKRIKLHCT
ncbi:hypothetical protein E2C01_098434 [Portunus trituberculatus]|uniref:Uncharacterized protein n=1 Tax=Portunus trituberculatus TaxID=210409 RepID=A0A5B7KCW5_PORTR|nr:hypothetical protein [Portunus trituberculatus]